MELAGVQQGRLLKSREISEKQKIPLKYLEQIVNTLKKNRLVVSVRGAEGGYRLARPPSEITLLEILRALEGDLSIMDKSDAEWAGDQGLFWRELDEKIQQLLRVPLSDFLSTRARDGLMYYI